MKNERSLLRDEQTQRTSQTSSRSNALPAIPMKRKREENEMIGGPSQKKAFKSFDQMILSLHDAHENASAPLPPAELTTDLFARLLQRELTDSECQLIEEKYVLQLRFE